MITSRLNLVQEPREKKSTSRGTCCQSNPLQQRVHTDEQLRNIKHAAATSELH